MEPAPPVHGVHAACAHRGQPAPPPHLQGTMKAVLDKQVSGYKNWKATITDKVCVGRYVWVGGAGSCQPAGATCC